ncbi:TetR/AcrR family transcriptional regulator C-terminal domain-containing protein [Nonomuraea sp. NPDC050394]|uniref:TetR/AcrR family transcriptional regulator C-terminal domain-containing protein n=1 Tax=Nonomuraea sp. NPDC050394 TaxID=3364363 RepID=UPI0037901604
MLSLEAIADTALRLLDEHGIEAMTMRRLAEDLGCNQSSLYRHVRSRDELTIIVADRAIRLGLQPPPPGLDWRSEAEWLAREFRAFLLGHPSVALLLRGTERLGPNSLQGVEFAVDRFIGAGLSPRRAAAAAGALATLIIGSVQFNLYLDATDPGERQARQTLYERLDPQTHPRMVRHATDIAGVGSEEEFEFGLRMFLDGIAVAVRGTTGDPAGQKADQLAVPD